MLPPPCKYYVICCNTAFYSKKQGVSCKYYRNIFEKRIETYMDMFFKFYFANFKKNTTFAQKKRSMVNNWLSRTAVILLFSSLCFSCGNNTARLSRRIDYIKTVGDSNPALALSMLDSLNTNIRNQPEGIVNKYDLVRLRIHDKAYILATSDVVVKQLITYYEKNGSDIEKQELYYYAGSVYRDLQDTPRSLDYFFKSAEIAEKSRLSDLLLLRNTYSNLHCLFFAVQDYAKSYEYAQKEYQLSRKIGKTELTCLTHLGVSFTVLDSIEHAKKIYKFMLDTICTDPKLKENDEILCSLLFNFSYLKDSINASKCFSILENMNVNDDNDARNYAYGEYYNMIGNRDSAVSSFSRILQDKKDLLRMYDASKALFHIFSDEGNIVEANKLANLFVDLSDSVDFGKRQEMAATVSNEFQYHRDQQEEQQIIEEKNQFKFWMIMAVIITFIVILIAITIIVHRRNIHLNELLSISNELNKHIHDKDMLQANIDEKEKELIESKKLLSKSENELIIIRNQLDKVNDELAKSDEELKKKEQLLTERMAQNQTFLNLLHQSELEGKAEDVIYAIRQSTKGLKNMKSSDWKQLYQAVDELYPLFKDRLLKELGNFTEQQMQVCYLMRIGLSKPQIQSMTELSRVTIWRWVKKYDWILIPDEEAETT